MQRFQIEELQMKPLHTLTITSCLLYFLSAIPLFSEQIKPNVIYILTDDLGYGDLSCYGQKKYQTPNIDLLASEGIKFTTHYSGNTVCSPSRAVLMTGQHSGHCYPVSYTHLTLPTKA